MSIIGFVFYPIMIFHIFLGYRYYYNEDTIFDTVAIYFFLFFGYAIVALVEGIKHALGPTKVMAIISIILYIIVIAVSFIAELNTDEDVANFGLGSLIVFITNQNKISNNNNKIILKYESSR